MPNTYRPVRVTYNPSEVTNKATKTTYFRPSGPHKDVTLTYDLKFTHNFTFSGKERGHALFNLRQEDDDHFQEGLME